MGSVFCVFVSVSVQVLDCAVALAYVCGSVTGSDFHQSVYIQVYQLMLGHRADACASHVMLCASYACVFITLDALRIVLNVFCIVCAAWASFDARASHVELSAPWVTEASLLLGLFFYTAANGIVRRYDILPMKFIFPFSFIFLSQQDL